MIVFLFVSVVERELSEHASDSIQKCFMHDSCPVEKYKLFRFSGCIKNSSSINTGFRMLELFYGMNLLHNGTEKKTFSEMSFDKFIIRPCFNSTKCEQVFEKLNCFQLLLH